MASGLGRGDDVGMSGAPGALTAVDRGLLDAAIGQAEKSRSEGGIPIGAALGTAVGTVVSLGHNLRVQTGDSTAHAETVCIRNAGRRRDWHRLILATTLSPCVMCAGATLLHRVPRVVIGECETFAGEPELLRSRGVEVVFADDAVCRGLMADFVRAHPALWDEDIGVPGGGA